MMAAKQATWLFLLLISLACSGWYFASSSSPKIKLDAKTLYTTTDMTIQHLTVYQYDKEGRLANSLKTPLMHHIPENNTHWLKKPYIIVTQDDQPSWEIQAEEATAIHGGEQITFNKEVKIQQKNETNAESTLLTESITYFPKDKFATTQSDVTFKQAGNIVNAKGMEANLAEKHVKLLSQARGKYVPNHG